MEREACVCDHGYERSDLCAEIIIIMATQYKRWGTCKVSKVLSLQPMFPRKPFDCLTAFRLFLKTSSWHLIGFPSDLK